MGKPIHLDSATMNKIRPSYSKVKVEVNLLAEFPEMKIVDSITKISRREKVKIQYDFYPSIVRNACSKDIIRLNEEYYIRNIKQSLTRRKLIEKEK